MPAKSPRKLGLSRRVSELEYAFEELETSRIVMQAALAILAGRAYPTPDPPAAAPARTNEAPAAFPAAFRTALRAQLRATMLALESEDPQFAATLQSHWDRCMRRLGLPELFDE